MFVHFWFSPVLKAKPVTRNKKYVSVQDAALQSTFYEFRACAAHELDELSRCKFRAGR